MSIFKPILGRRYYKVKALVPAKTVTPENEPPYMVALGCHALADELSKCDASIRYHYTLGRQWREEKYVSKEITILEEVPFEQYADRALNAYVETEEEYRAITTTNQYEAFIKTKWLEQARPCFSEGFIIFVWNKVKKQASQHKPFGSSSTAVVENLLENYSPAMEALNAIKDEKISQDVKVLCFLQLTEII